MSDVKEREDAMTKDEYDAMFSDVMDKMRVRGESMDALAKTDFCKIVPGFVSQGFFCHLLSGGTSPERICAGWLSGLPKDSTAEIRAWAEKYGYKIFGDMRDD